MDIFEIGSNCPIELINPRKAVKDPNDFYDGIAKRQADLMQQQHIELKKRARLNTFTSYNRKQGVITEQEGKLDSNFNIILYMFNSNARQEKK